jgi:hypothetical protein
VRGQVHCKSSSSIVLAVGCKEGGWVTIASWLSGVWEHYRRHTSLPTANPWLTETDGFSNSSSAMVQAAAGHGWSEVLAISTCVLLLGATAFLLATGSATAQGCHG